MRSFAHYLAFSIVVAASSAMACEGLEGKELRACSNKAFDKAMVRLIKANKLGKCTDQARVYANGLREGIDLYADIDQCLLTASAQSKEAKTFEKRIQRLKKAGF